MFIVNNKKQILFDNATGSGSDTSTDPSSRSVNPNNYLPPVIGGGGLVKILIIVVLSLLSIYLIKKISL